MGRPTIKTKIALHPTLFFVGALIILALPAGLLYERYGFGLGARVLGTGKADIISCSSTPPSLMTACRGRIWWDEGTRLSDIASIMGAEHTIVSRTTLSGTVNVEVRLRESRHRFKSRVIIPAGQPARHTLLNDSIFLVAWIGAAVACAMLSSVVWRAVHRGKR